MMKKSDAARIGRSAARNPAGRTNVTGFTSRALWAAERNEGSPRSFFCYCCCFSIMLLSMIAVVVIVFLIV